MNTAARHAVHRNQRAGLHYFDHDTLRHFGSIVHDGYNHPKEGTYVVVSDMVDTERRYYVVLVHVDGNTERVSHPILPKMQTPDEKGWQSIHVADNYARARAARREVNA